REVLDAYFNHFHEILPLIHLPSFDPAKCPAILAAALSSIGVMFLREDSSSRDSWLFSANYLDLLSQWVADWHFLAPAVFIRSSRWVLAIDSSIIWPTGPVESSSYDNSLCILTNRRAAVDLSELPRTFPCMESLWQARTTSSWKALMSAMSESATDASPQVIVRGLLSGQPPPSDLPFWARRLPTQLVPRQLWDAKQAEKAYMAECFSRVAQLKTEFCLLRGLKVLADSVAVPKDVLELLNSNIITLIVYYSHLHTSGDLLDLLVYVLRSSVRSVSSSDKHAIKAAAQKLATSIQRNSQQSRRMALHAAQIVAVASKFLVLAPCEILRVFMGFTFLMAFARYSRHDANRSHVDEAIDLVRLDDVRPSLTRKESVEQWVQYRGPAMVGPIDNISDPKAFTEIKELALKTLGGLRRWGLAEKFIKIITVFEFD
ncbi:hypothetical protein EK21DRAFT_79610, partial [Setomelanomma holmii]